MVEAGEKAARWEPGGKSRVHLHALRLRWAAADTALISLAAAD
jgi:hypothetical protein